MAEDSTLQTEKAQNQETPMEQQIDAPTRTIHEALPMEHFQKSYEHVQETNPIAFAAYADPDSDSGAKVRRIAEHVLSTDGGGSDD